jgi:hypothetical protein
MLAPNPACGRTSERKKKEREKIINQQNEEMKTDQTLSNGKS